MLQQWEEGDGGESGSSDGGGSSYFSGERLERDKSSSASPMPSHHSLSGSRDLASAHREVSPRALSPLDMCLIAEAVLVKGSHGPVHNI